MVACPMPADTAHASRRPIGHALVAAAGLTRIGRHVGPSDRLERLYSRLVARVISWHYSPDRKPWSITTRASPPSLGLLLLYFWGPIRARDSAFLQVRPIRHPSTPVLAPKSEGANVTPVRTAVRTAFTVADGVSRIGDVPMRFGGS